MRGTVEKRGKTYSIRLDLGRDPKTGKRRQKRISGFKTKKEAETELAKIISDYERGTYVVPSKMTIADFLRRWLEIHQENLAFTTARQYKQIIEMHVIPALGEILVNKLNPIRIQEFFQEVLRNGRKDNKKTHGKELKPASVNYIYRVMRCAFNAAVKWGLVAENPVLGTEPPAATGNDPVMLTAEQVDQLLSGLEGTYLWFPAYL